MMRERRAAAERVAAQLFEAEKAIDLALQKTASLVGMLSSAHTEARLSAMVGQAAIERGTGAMGELMRARREIVETHKELSATQIQIGLGQVAFGEGFEKLAPAEPEVAQKRLQAVG